MSNSLDLVTNGVPKVISSTDCGYCHGKKTPIENGYSLESYRSIYRDYINNTSNTNTNTNTKDVKSDLKKDKKRDKRDKVDKNDESEAIKLFNHYPNNVTLGLSTEIISPEIYEILMNKGFRRSGNFIYRPDLIRNCCRLFTIRTNLSLLKPTKEHRHTINKFINEINDIKPETVKKKVKNEKFDIFKIINTENEFIKSGRTNKFKSVLEPANFTKEKFELYKKYQSTIHTDKEEDVTERGFKNFLCSSPFTEKYLRTVHQDTKGLSKEEMIQNDKNIKYWENLNKWRDDGFEKNHKDKLEFVGPVHECYYLDDKLIAIAVLDFLPNSISSVYFIWDYSYSKLGLGTLSAIREILLTFKLNKDYYYLGYYLSDCQKMKYKSKFSGEILDLNSNKYFQLDKIEEIIKDGLLFSMDKENDNYKENFIHGLPKLYDAKKDGEFINNSEFLYGFKAMNANKEKINKIFGKLNDKINNFFQKFGLDIKLKEQDDFKIWEDVDNSFDKYKVFSLPKVSPGLISLQQMYDEILPKLLDEEDEDESYSESETGSEGSETGSETGSDSGSETGSEAEAETETEPEIPTNNKAVKFKLFLSEIDEMIKFEINDKEINKLIIYFKYLGINEKWLNIIFNKIINNLFNLIRFFGPEVMFNFNSIIVI
ncbi:hypothetical protein B5S33_g3891 [[Candida] boidinii]|nr:hypothetical protein B5S30_g3519 [[Candida] boidinii]OWB85231.1 hypothetical protein B5S33_g3891 [[Candida] boidinii]GMF99399.1 unnamed protein product [[Candida] boidinii]